MKRVLIVEDDDDHRRLLELLLAGRYETASAAHAEEALAALAVWRADAILVDLLLPGMSGRELAARIRSDPALAGVSLVAISARSLHTERDVLRAGGFDDCLPKMGLDAHALERVLDSLLDERRAPRTPDSTHDALRRAYVEGLPARLDAIAVERARAAGPASTAARAELRRLLHNIAGTGLSYGFVALGEVARVAERHAERWLRQTEGAAPGDVLVDLDAGLAALACHAAELRAALPADEDHGPQADDRRPGSSPSGRRSP